MMTFGGQHDNNLRLHDNYKPTHIIKKLTDKEMPTNSTSLEVVILKMTTFIFCKKLCLWTTQASPEEMEITDFVSVRQDVSTEIVRDIEAGSAK
jgi:hypothetical protein